MANSKLSDAEAKAILLHWPTRTTIWPPPGGTGHWIRGQPVSPGETGPCLSAPGATLFRTQPDGLWAHFRKRASCDVVAVEVCGNTQNLNDKRSRYIPASHSIVLHCSKSWLDGKIATQGGGTAPRWEATGMYKQPPKSRAGVDVPVRHLRVLYALPDDLYCEWAKEHVPTGYEFFCPHSSLDSYTSQKMQEFLGQMSIASQFYLKPQG